jgi:hypothetical protein
MGVVGSEQKPQADDHSYGGSDCSRTEDLDIDELVPND